MHASGNDQLAGIFLRMDHSFLEIFGTPQDREGSAAASRGGATTSNTEKMPCDSPRGKEGAPC
jgi:hypothetical protein